MRVHHLHFGHAGQGAVLVDAISTNQSYITLTLLQHNSFRTTAERPPKGSWRTGYLVASFLIRVFDNFLRLSSKGKTRMTLAMTKAKNDTGQRSQTTVRLPHVQEGIKQKQGRCNRSLWRVRFSASALEHQRKNNKFQLISVPLP